jgi:hypothetical protein
MAVSKKKGGRAPVYRVSQAPAGPAGHEILPIIIKDGVFLVNEAKIFFPAAAKAA